MENSAASAYFEKDWQEQRSCAAFLHMLTAFRFRSGNKTKLNRCGRPEEQYICVLSPYVDLFPG